MNHDANSSEIADLRQRLREEMIAREQLETELREKVRTLDTLLCAIPDVVYLKDIQGRLVHANPMFADWTGYKVEDVLGKTNAEILPPELAVQAEQSDQKVLEKKKRMEFDQSAQMPDGSWKAINTIKTPIFDDNNQIKGIVGISRDVTKQREATDLLHRRLDFDSIITTVSSEFINLKVEEIDNGIERALGQIGIFDKDDRCYVCLLNEEKTHFDCTHEWCGEGISGLKEFFQEVPLEALPFATKQLLAGEVFHAPNISALPPEAELERLRWEHNGIRALIAVPLFSAGEAFGAVGFESVRSEKQWSEQAIVLLRIVGEIIVNALGRKRAEQALHEQELQLTHASRLATMGEMVASIAHEVNQPLYAISNYALACKMTLENSDTACSEKVGQWINQISQESSRAAEIIRTLREFTKVTPPGDASTDIVQAVQDAMKLLAFDFHREKINATIDVPEEKVQVEGDPVQLQQVLINLLRNAVEAILEQPPEMRAVEIKLHTHDSTVDLTIKDTGPAVSDEIAEKMFDTFFTTKPQGMGMGLAISRRIAEAHHGKLWMERTEDSCTRFHLELKRSHK